jgi:cystathionine beta-lyase
VSSGALSAFLNGFQHFGLGYSWGGYESLIIKADFKRTAGTFETQGPLVRIHAGLEDPDDLIADLEAGFARMKAAS